MVRGVAAAVKEVTATQVSQDVGAGVRFRWCVLYWTAVVEEGLLVWPATLRLRTQEPQAVSTHP